MVSPLAFAINLFGLALINIISKEAGNLGAKNVVISPASISTAMSMVILGAEDQTKNQLFAGLDFNAQSQFSSNASNVHQEFKKFIQQVKDNSNAANSNLTLTISNLLLATNSVEILHSYEDKLADYYQAGVKLFNFVTQGEEVKNYANDYVSKETKGTIPTILEAAPEQGTVAILLNTLYFKGKWINPFPYSTEKDTFFNNGQDEVQIDFMSKGQFNVQAASETVGGQDCTIFSLPYQQGLDMVVVLPAENNGLSQMENPKYEEIQGAINKFESLSLSYLQFPKFKLDGSFRLIPYLKELGIKNLFDDSANLSGISEKQKLKVSEVIHKTFIKVDEKGTEAAAVTSVSLSVPSSASISTTVIKVNRPFMFFIRDTKSGIFLFSGTVNQLS